MKREINFWLFSAILRLAVKFLPKDAKGTWYWLSLMPIDDESPNKYYNHAVSRCNSVIYQNPKEWKAVLVERLNKLVQRNNQSDIPLKYDTAEMEYIKILIGLN